MDAGTADTPDAAQKEREMMVLRETMVLPPLERASQAAEMGAQGHAGTEHARHAAAEQEMEESAERTQQKRRLLVQQHDWCGVHGRGG